MPKLVKFNISNFRGIQSAEISIDNRFTSNIITLVGLNESGKTTILEALSHFSTGDRTIPNLLAQVGSAEHHISMLPIDKRPNFTGDVSIKATLEFSKEEFNHYLDRLDRRKDIITKRVLETRQATIEKRFTFTDSAFKKVQNLWNGFDFHFKKTKSAKNFKAVDLGIQAQKEFWLSLINDIENDTFELVYFPSFLVDMPSLIYLEEHTNETPTNLYYRNAIQDILHSLPEPLDLKKHVIDRLKAAKAESNAPAWFSLFLGKPENKLVQSVIAKIEAAINKEVLDAWSRVFSHDIGRRRFKVDFAVDGQRNDLSYVKFSIADASSDYDLNERSLGFRWFFSYLLFTQFKAKSVRPTVFLFDEPAANLHAKAQTELLGSFEKIVEGNNKIIYSTHSPHMINPDWLGSAHIVRNAAVDLDGGEDVSGFDTSPTDVIVNGYGEFVAKNPEKRTYFQPVYEKLLYQAPMIIGNPPYLCVEGISDYYLLSYVSKRIDDYALTIVPGVGAGYQSDPLPIIYGAGKDLLVLLDADLAGLKEQKRIRAEGVLAAEKILTLADIDQQYANKELEDLISNDTKDLIRERFAGKCGKKEIRYYLLEACASNKDNMLTKETISNVSAILVSCGTRVGSSS